jgi:hypothetical protein
MERRVLVNLLLFLFHSRKDAEKREEEETSFFFALTHSLPNSTQIGMESEDYPSPSKKGGPTVSLP